MRWSKHTQISSSKANPTLKHLEYHQLIKFQHPSGRVSQTHKVFLIAGTQVCRPPSACCLNSSHPTFSRWGGLRTSKSFFARPIWSSNISSTFSLSALNSTDKEKPTCGLVVSTYFKNFCRLHDNPRYLHLTYATIQARRESAILVATSTSDYFQEHRPDI